MTNSQKAHYEAMHDAYERHYYDATSLDYRRKFVLGPALAGFDLNHRRVADIACGSGWNTLLMLERFPDANFHGFDISERACDDYRKNTGFEATCCDLSVYRYSGKPFDFALVVGGLHHMVNDLPRAVSGVADMVAPDGYLFAYEPNGDFFLNKLREVWYRRDHLFEEESERALGLEELQRHFSGRMELVDRQFSGGPAYVLLLNSLVVRMPLGAKKPLAGVLMGLERLYGTLPGRAPFPAFTSTWKKL